jgi:hypothetical protein
MSTAQGRQESSTAHVLTYLLTYLLMELSPS